eukprot:9815093-Lingulodinium_polyedra.AAC.1
MPVSQAVALQVRVGHLQVALRDAGILQYVAVAKAQTHMVALTEENAQAMLYAVAREAQHSQ